MLCVSSRIKKGRHHDDMNTELPVVGLALCCGGLSHVCNPEQPLGVSVQVLATPLPVWFPANVPGKVVEHGPSAWTPVTHMGDAEGIPSSWLQCGYCGYLWSDSEDRRSLSLCVSNSAFKTKKINIYILNPLGGRETPPNAY